MNINCYELEGYWYASFTHDGIQTTASKKKTAKDAIIKAVGAWLNKYNKSIKQKINYGTRQ